MILMTILMTITLLFISYFNIICESRAADDNNADNNNDITTLMTMMMVIMMMILSGDTISKRKK